MHCVACTHERCLATVSKWSFEFDNNTKSSFNGIVLDLDLGRTVITASKFPF